MAVQLLNVRITELEEGGEVTCQCPECEKCRALYSTPSRILLACGGRRPPSISQQHPKNLHYE
jgi:hypothetical protein